MPASLYAQSSSSTPSATTATATTPAATTGASAAAASVGEAGGGPAETATYIKGFNATLTSSSQHDSGEGWSNSLTPDVSYSLNSHLGGDFSVPYYTYIPYSQFSGTLLHPTLTRVIVHNVIGDAAGTVHFSVSPSFMDYVFTVSGGFPVGNTTYGLSSQQYTYNINNHFDKSIGIFSPEVEIGFGDSNSLTQHRVLKTSSIVGNLAFFTAGTGVDLPWNLSFSADAYEQLPLSNESTYKTLRNLRRKLFTVQTGTSPAEDNGFETSLDIPLNPHVTLSGIYNRSLRQHEDTAGFSLTFVLRVPKPAPPKSPAAAAPAAK
jgi:hypothetical protein